MSNRVKTIKKKQERNKLQLQIVWINSPKFLGKFYRETKPQQSSDSATENDKGYHQNSLINIRGDINRHLSDIEGN
ncbi:hypothetical protein KUTeg_009210 [Tegillarca granosa]|uniref:Uncharacterized protein n=1 Tax=Tegillarca granosa TaxID=220873 RepID=A0ABQ9F7A5_TEGGR|nr:hypothetical protein KUTeg_009210 [Tegillarca granosa]